MDPAHPPTSPDAIPPPRHDPGKRQGILSIAAQMAGIAVVGVAAVISPILIWPPLKLNHAPLFPLLATGIEHLGIATLIGLALAGFLGGLFARLPFPVAGLATVALLPVATIAEIIVDSTSHNLFPFEFVMYAVISIPAILAAGLGRLAQRARVRTPLPADTGNQGTAK